MLSWHTITRGAWALILAGAVGVGFAQNVEFAQTISWAWAAVAVLASAVKLATPFVPGWYRSAILATLFGASVLFDGLCAYGHMTITRGSRLEVYESAKAAHYAAQREVDALAGRLDVLAAPAPPKRPSAAVQAAISGQMQRDRCKAEAECMAYLAPLVGEREAAKVAEAAIADFETKRAALAAELMAARARAAASPLPDKSPDPQAAQLAAIFKIPETQAAGWQTVLGWLLLELCIAGAAAVLARPAEIAHAPPRSAPSAGPQPAARKRRTSPTAIGALRALADGSATAPGVTREPDGWLRASQRAWGAALGLNGSGANRTLRALASAGEIELDATPSGTRVRVK